MLGFNRRQCLLIGTLWLKLGPTVEVVVGGWWSGCHMTKCVSVSTAIALQDPGQPVLAHAQAPHQCSTKVSAKCRRPGVLRSQASDCARSRAATAAWFLCCAFSSAGSFSSTCCVSTKAQGSRVGLGKEGDAEAPVETHPQCTCDCGPS